MIPTRPSVADVVNRAARSARPRREEWWTWCEGCGEWFPMGEYVFHLQLVSAGKRHRVSA